MKKFLKLIVLSFIAVIFILSIVTIVSNSTSYAAMAKGHWLYDKAGEKIGCKSPGRDCDWGSPEG